MAVSSPVMPAMPRGMLLLLVLINVLWGGSTLAAKQALNAGLPPMTLAFLRFGLSAVLMYLAALGLRVDLRVARRDWGGFWAMGVVGLALTYLLVYEGIARTHATNASFLIATEPVFLALLACLFLRERMPGSKVLGILAGLTGASLIVTGGGLPQFSGIILGDLLITFGMVSEASASIIGKPLVARYPAVAVITYQMTTGAIALAPFAAYELFFGKAAEHLNLFGQTSVLWGLLYLIIPCTLFAYTVWFSVLDKREAGEMSVFLFIQPVVGALLGVFLLKDAITACMVGGAALVLLGLGLIHRRPILPPSV